MGTTHSRTSTTKHEGFDDFWESYCPNKERKRVHFDEPEETDQEMPRETPRESYIYGMLENSPERTFGDSSFTNGFDMRNQKNLHSLFAMKDLEESQKKKPENSQPEKFRGFAYKERSIEPFERVYVNY